MTGQLILREPPIPVEVDAYVEGVVAEVLPDEGVVVETRARVHPGHLRRRRRDARADRARRSTVPDDELTAARLDREHAGKIVVGGAHVHVRRADAARASSAWPAVVVGGFDDSDLRGAARLRPRRRDHRPEELGITLVLTEGFGRIRMAERTFDLLETLEGQAARRSAARPRSAPA